LTKQEPYLQGRNHEWPEQSEKRKAASGKAHGCEIHTINSFDLLFYRETLFSFFFHFCLCRIGRVESLNVAIATAIICAEFRRRV
jgi:hypothetical protein